MDLLIEPEFIIAIANNSYNLINNIENLIESILDYNILTEDEIRMCISKKKLFNVINMLSNYAVLRLVRESFETLTETINDNFFEVDLKKALIEADKIFSKFESKMFIQTKNKLWVEILKYICMYYFLRLVYGKKKIKKIEDLTEKIQNDMKFLQEAFSEKLGENTVKENISLIEKLLEFFESTEDMISFSISSLRENLGVMFDLEFTKKLIEWKVDFNSSEKKAAIADAEKVLKNFKDENAKKNPLVDYIILEKKSMEEQKETLNNLESVESDEKNSKDASNNRRATLNIMDFLGQINDIPDSIQEEGVIVGQNDEGALNLEKAGSTTVDFQLSKKIVDVADDDIIMQGNMQKKSSTG